MTLMNPNPIGVSVKMMQPIECAVWLAVISHQGQVDKSGRMYILHPLRVMGRMEINDEAGQIVAVLHDVVEDTPTSLAIVRSCIGYNYCQLHGIVEAVDAITRRHNETYKDYIRRCVQNDIARRVKIADLEDNIDPRRTYSGGQGIRNRYRDALRFIELGEWK